MLKRVSHFVEKINIIIYNLSHQIYKKNLKNIKYLFLIKNENNSEMDPNRTSTNSGIIH